MLFHFSLRYRVACITRIHAWTGFNLVLLGWGVVKEWGRGIESKTTIDIPELPHV
jgi:hypothetical protein